MDTCVYGHTHTCRPVVNSQPVIYSNKLYLFCGAPLLKYENNFFNILVRILYVLASYIAYSNKCMHVIVYPCMQAGVSEKEFCEGAERGGDSGG